MAINFTECDVIIGGAGIVATSASIEESCSFLSVSPIGSIIGFETANSSPSSNIRISYPLNLEKEVLLKEVLKIKSNPFDISPLKIEIAGLKCSGYITNIDLNIAPNQPVSVNASLVSYENLIGKIVKKKGTVNYDLNPLNFGHSWSSFIAYQNSGFESTYEMNYSCSISYSPIYILGKKNPYQVMFDKGQEKFEMTKDKFLSVNFSGELESNSIFNTGQISGIVIYSMKNRETKNGPHFSFNLLDTIIKNSSLQPSVGSYLTTSITAERQF